VEEFLEREYLLADEVRVALEDDECPIRRRSPRPAGTDRPERHPLADPCRRCGFSLAQNSEVSAPPGGGQAQRGTPSIPPAAKGLI
jgi:hypothetical protein